MDAGAESNCRWPMPINSAITSRRRECCTKREREKEREPRRTKTRHEPRWTHPTSTVGTETWKHHHPTLPPSKALEASSIDQVSNFMNGFCQSRSQRQHHRNLGKTISISVAQYHWLSTPWLRTADERINIRIEKHNKESCK